MPFADDSGDPFAPSSAAATRADDGARWGETRPPTEKQVSAAPKARHFSYGPVNSSSVCARVAKVAFAARLAAAQGKEVGAEARASGVAMSAFIEELLAAQQSMPGASGQAGMQGQFDGGGERPPTEKQVPPPTSLAENVVLTILLPSNSVKSECTG